MDVGETASLHTGKSARVMNIGTRAGLGHPRMRQDESGIDHARMAYAALHRAQRGLRQHDHDVDLVRLLLLADLPAARMLDGDAALHGKADVAVGIDRDGAVLYELVEVLACLGEGRHRL